MFDSTLFCLKQEMTRDRERSEKEAGSHISACFILLFSFLVFLACFITEYNTGNNLYLLYNKVPHLKRYWLYTSFIFWLRAQHGVTCGS